MRWAGRVACVGEKRSAYVVVVKPERRCHAGPRFSWDENLNMYLKK
jgi:hypothetical protein